MQKKKKWSWQSHLQNYIWEWRAERVAAAAAVDVRREWKGWLEGLVRDGPLTEGRPEPETIYCMMEEAELTKCTSLSKTFCC